MATTLPPEQDPQSEENKSKQTITVRQEAAALLIAKGMTVSATAREIKCNPGTIWAWYKIPLFNERIEELRREMTERAISRLSDLMAGLAIDKLIARLERTDPDSGEVACTLDDIKAAFDLYGGLRSNTELAQKLDKLLAHMEEAKK